MCLLTHHDAQVLYEPSSFEAKRFSKALDQLESLPFGSSHHPDSQGVTLPVHKASGGCHMLAKARLALHHLSGFHPPFLTVPQVFGGKDRMPLVEKAAPVVAPSRLTMSGASAAKGLTSLVNYLSRQTQYEMADTTITFVANGFSTFPGLSDLLQVPQPPSRNAFRPS